MSRCTCLRAPAKFPLATASPQDKIPKLKTPRIVLPLLIVLAMISKTPAAPDLTSQLNNLFREFDQPDGPGASVAIVRDGKIAFSRGYGLANLEDKTPCRTNTNFRLASVTKQFTALAV